MNALSSSSIRTLPQLEESQMEVTVPPIWKHFLQMPEPKNTAQFEAFYTTYMKLVSIIKKEESKRNRNENQNFYCPICTSKYMWKHSLTEHLKKKHPQVSLDNYKYKYSEFKK